MVKRPYSNLDNLVSALTSITENSTERDGFSTASYGGSNKAIKCGFSHHLSLFLQVTYFQAENFTQFQDCYPSFGITSSFNSKEYLLRYSLPKSKHIALSGIVSHAQPRTQSCVLSVKNDCFHPGSHSVYVLKEEKWKRQQIQRKQQITTTVIKYN